VRLRALSYRRSYGTVVFGALPGALLVCPSLGQETGVWANEHVP
jgi:hypothetical protein